MNDFSGIQQNSRLLVKAGNFALGYADKEGIFLNGKTGRTFSGSEVRGKPPYIVFIKEGDGEQLETRSTYSFNWEIVIYTPLKNNDKKGQQEARSIYERFINRLLESPIYLDSTDYVEGLSIDPEGKDDPANTLSFGVTLLSVGLA